MDGINLILCEVRLLLGGITQPNISRLKMISVHHLSTTLTGCVMLCSKLDATLDKVSGLRGTGTQGWAKLVKEKIKWAFWTEDAAKESIEDLQRHKLSLSLMLSILQW